MGIPLTQLTEAERALFPDPINTDRLLLRSPQPGDGVEVNQAIRESYADLHEWMDWANYLPDVEETEQRKLGSGSFCVVGNRRSHVDVVVMQVEQQALLVHLLAF